MGIKWLSCIPRVVELTAPRYVDRFFGRPATLEVLGDFAKMIEKINVSISSMSAMRPTLVLLLMHYVS